MAKAASGGLIHERRNAEGRVTSFQVKLRRRGHPDFIKCFATREETELALAEVLLDHRRGLRIDRRAADRVTLGRIVADAIETLNSRRRDVKGADVEICRLQHVLREEPRLCENSLSSLKADRQAIVDGLSRQLKKGDKALIGNSAYRRYLRKTGGSQAFEIDPGKLAEEARFDGITVLRTNARVTPLQAVLRYRDLSEVEALFRAAKASFDTRPIFHQSDAAIRGHVFCSFLALVLAKELMHLCADRGLRPEWQPLLNDLDRLQQATIEKDGRSITTRTHVAGDVGNVFKAAGVALPHTLDETPV